MKAKVSLLSIILLLVCHSASAQFYTGGSEPASSKWSSIETDNYKIIYLRGLDSLARVYANTLENAAEIVGSSAGFAPNASYKKKMPVILRSNTSLANGLVSWTPRRMELNTIGDAYRPEAYPWEVSVSLHESRHSSQMQFAGAKPFRWGKILSGELLAGGLAAVYPGPAFMEGDAVVAETALTNAGRGRSADFLEYYRVSFAQGDTRDFWRWRYGSVLRYTPDFYRAGYIAMAGLRSFYDVPDFTARYYERIAEHHGVAFFNFQKTVREQTGKNFDQAWTEIAAELQEEWSEDEARRAPFMHAKQHDRYIGYYDQLRSLQVHDKGIFAIHNGISSASTLVNYSPDGRMKVLSSFSAEASRIRLSKADKSLYWSEFRRHARWENLSYSDIYRRDSLGRKTRLSKKERYFNPSVSDDGRRLAVSEYSQDGRSSVVILDSGSGERLSQTIMPDGMRVVESLWLGEDIYFSAITEDGFGIWRLDDMHCLLPASPVNINELWEHEGEIMLSCDRTTVNELYALVPEDGSVYQISSTRHGASDFSFNNDGSRLYYTQPGVDARLVYSTRTDSLLRRKVDFSERSEFPMVEKLAAQEGMLLSNDKEHKISEPAKYSRLGHLLRLHSWVPAYVNIDNVSSLSMSDLTSLAAPGASLFFQNDMGDAFGSLGYKAMDSNFRLRHSAHLNFSYSGLLPVLELKLDVNDRFSNEMLLVKDQVTKRPKLESAYSNKPLVSGSLTAYVPLSFSSGGVSRGFIPQIRYGFNNDTFTHNERTLNTNRLTLSMRGYIMNNIAPSDIYPNLGIGAELGYSLRPDLTDYFNQNLFIHVYGYAPGIMDTHGLKLAFLHEQRFGKGIFAEAYANTAPRGYDYSITQMIAAYPESTRLSLDYTMPLWFMDWGGMSPLFYLKNLEFTPHIDLTLCGSDATRTLIYSAGADLALRMGNFLWIPYDTRIGLSFNYLPESAFMKENFNLSMIFNIDF